MATVSSFDQWQKDVFFSAAEEVQESADTLESIYRMWVRLRSDPFQSELSHELFRELRTALGTAKWQLEEFERAAGVSHEDRSAAKNTVTRHRQFVEALGNQISHIDMIVNNSLEESNQPLSWIQLNKEERDDLANFLSTPPPTLQEAKDKHTIPFSVKGFKETVTINKESRYVVEVAAKEPCKQSDGQKRTWSSPDIGAWKIVIADEEGAEREMAEKRLKEAPRSGTGRCGFLRSVESVAKSKLFRNGVPKAKSGEPLQMRRGLSNYLDLKGVTRFAQRINGLSERSKNCFSSCNEDPKVCNVQHLVGRAGGLQRHIQSSKNYMQFGRSLRITMLLLLTVFLVVPYVLYST